MRCAKHAGSGRKTGVALHGVGKGSKRKQNGCARKTMTAGRGDDGSRDMDAPELDDEGQFDDYLLSMSSAGTGKNLAALRMIEQLREDRRLQMEIDDYPA
jgi:hypothetical protein